MKYQNTDLVILIVFKDHFYKPVYYIYKTQHNPQIYRYFEMKRTVWVYSESKCHLAILILPVCLLTLNVLLPGTFNNGWHVNLRH